MKFSSFTTDGLRAVCWMAIRYGQGSVSVSQIAKKENIPQACLGQILNRLKKEGLVKSVRGPQGGYVLSKAPAQITLKELLNSLDPSFEQGRQSKRLAQASEDIVQEVRGAEKFFWDLFFNAVEKELSKLTLKDVLDRTRAVKKTKSASAIGFSI